MSLPESCNNVTVRRRFARSLSIPRYCRTYRSIQKVNVHWETHERQWYLHPHCIGPLSFRCPMDRPFGPVPWRHIAIPHLSVTFSPPTLHMPGCRLNPHIQRGGPLCLPAACRRSSASGSWYVGAADSRRQRGTAKSPGELKLAHDFYQSIYLIAHTDSSPISCDPSGVYPAEERGRDIEYSFIRCTLCKIN
jgi:hypothetical protein